MLRVESTTNLIEGFTEFEEEILFDDDDPDFDHHKTQLQSFLFKSDRNLLFRQTTKLTLTSSNLPARMSLASVHPADLHSSHGSLTALSHSLDDITAACWSPSALSEQVLTIEDLRNQMYCCFSCGVSWADSHVSLDCSECGGYALDRPCMVCDGQCGTVWKRDLSLTHASSKAKWSGSCKLSQNGNQQNTDNTMAAEQLSKRLEKLSANS